MPLHPPRQGHILNIPNPRHVPRASGLGDHLYWVDENVHSRWDCMPFVTTPVYHFHQNLSPVQRSVIRVPKQVHVSVIWPTDIPDAFRAMAHTLADSYALHKIGFSWTETFPTSGSRYLKIATPGVGLPHDTVVSGEVIQFFVSAFDNTYSNAGSPPGGDPLPAELAMWNEDYAEWYAKRDCFGRKKFVMIYESAEATSPEDWVAFMTMQMNGSSPWNGAGPALTTLDWELVLAAHCTDFPGVLQPLIDSRVRTFFNLH